MRTAILFIIIFITGCSQNVKPDEQQSSDDLAQYNRDDAALHKIFNEKYNSFINKCNELSFHSNSNIYMDTNEYHELKSFVQDNGKAAYELLINRFEEQGPGLFSFFLINITQDEFKNVYVIVSEKYKAKQSSESYQEDFFRDYIYELKQELGKI